MDIMSTPPRSPVGKHNFDMNITSTPLRSPVKKQNFGMGITPTPPPEPKDDLGMCATLSTSPVPKKKSNFGFKEPLFLPEFEDSDIIPVSDEGPSETGTHRPTEAKEPLGSSSKERGEFHITTSYMHLTLAYTAWI
jgi:hypothetical protein